MKKNINMEKFLDKFKENYCYLYENENVEGYGEAVTRFDEFLKNHQSFVTEFSKYRGDCISSDREAAAFTFTLNELQ